jgi:hypothetical protein
MLMDLLLLGRHDPWKARCRYEILREETLKSRIVTQKKDKVFVAFSFPVTSRNSDELKPGLGKQLGRQTRDQRAAHHRHRSPRRGVFFFDPMIYYIIEFHGIVHRTIAGPGRHGELLTTVPSCGRVVLCAGRSRRGIQVGPYGLHSHRPVRDGPPRRHPSPPPAGQLVIRSPAPAPAAPPRWPRPVQVQTPGCGGPGANRRRS